MNKKKREIALSKKLKEQARWDMSHSNFLQTSRSYHRCTVFIMWFTVGAYVVASVLGLLYWLG